jgi:hypothetical protein
MGTREFFVRNPYVSDPPRSEDLILWVNVLGKEKVVDLSELLYFYRENPALDLSKYYKMLAAHRVVFRRYAPAVGGFGLLVELYGRSLLKESVYRVAARVGATAHLATRRRLKPLSVEELASAQSTVNAICRAAAHRLQPLDLQQTVEEQEICL